MGVVTVGVAGTVGGDDRSGQGDISDETVGAARVLSEDVVAGAPGDVVNVGDEDRIWDFDVACGVMVCNEVMTSVVRLTEPLESVIVLVLDVKDVRAEGPEGAERLMELELEDV